MRVSAIRSDFIINQKIFLFLLTAVLFSYNTSFGFNKVSLLSDRNVLADVAEKRIVSVVNISSTKIVRNNTQRNPFFNDPFFENFFGRNFNNIPRERREKSLGSGVIVSKEGLILTNNHVVENAEEIMVKLSDGRELKAEIVGTDPKSDVAVLKLKGKNKGLKPIPFGDSSRLRLGEIVLAMGNPFGLDHTVTMGIVSAKGRANVGIADYEDFIQTDAAINPGNSGGALINLKGELVGINTAIISKSGGYQGIGFAIPSNMARSIMNSLITNGKVIRGWLGVSIQNLDQKLSKAMGIEGTNGVLVSEVVKGSPAEKAGLKRGDVIVRIDNKKVINTGQIRTIIASLGVGTSVTVQYIRDGKYRRKTFKLGQLPDNIQSNQYFEGKKGTLGGITLAPLNRQNRRKFYIPDQVKKGVLIASVKQGSPAQLANLRAGDVILEVNRREVNSVKDFIKAYEKSPKNNTLLLIYRNGRTYYLVLRK